MAKKTRKTAVKSKSVDTAIHDDIQNGKIEAAMAAAKKAVSKPKAKPAPKAAPARTLRRRMSGDDVSAMQKKLGVPASGSFDIGTEAAVREWQKANGMTADGVVTPEALAKM